MNDENIFCRAELPQLNRPSDQNISGYVHESFNKSLDIGIVLDSILEGLTGTIGECEDSVPSPTALLDTVVCLKTATDDNLAKANRILKSLFK